ncbi:MAG TPA: hypothetical protein VMO52_09730 [Acidimicrobiia bacterium]|nr:hypothetical protein [Acidimicrobiia bacterium]
MANPIEVDGLTKSFKVPVRETGVRESVRSLFRRDFRDVRAVESTLSFTIVRTRGFSGPPSPS